MSTPIESQIESPAVASYDFPAGTRLLAIDTSAAISVAVVSADGSYESRNLAEFRLHAEQLSVLIAQALAAAGIEPDSLTGIAVGTGPGPFTGLRVGLAAARTLAFALNIPLYGVSSLDAIAVQTVKTLGPASFTHNENTLPNPEILVATDARRREIYWAKYRAINGTADIAIIQGPNVGKASKGAEELGIASDFGITDKNIVPPIIAGQGAVLYPDLLPLTPGAPILPEAGELGRIALSRAKHGIAQPTDPLYLRRPDIHGQQS